MRNNNILRSPENISFEIQDSNRLDYKTSVIGEKNSSKQTSTRFNGKKSFGKKDKALIEDSVVYSNENEGGDVEVLFLPYIDDNEIWMTYHETDIKNKRGEYPTVDFSTFIDEYHEHILI